MTKKQIKEQGSFHKYGTHRDTAINAIFFDHKSGDVDGQRFNGFKYCIYGRVSMVTKKDLIDELHRFLNGVIENTEWFIQLATAPTDKQRFTVPIGSSGLNCLVKYEKKDGTYFK